MINKLLKLLFNHSCKFSKFVAIEHLGFYGTQRVTKRCKCGQKKQFFIISNNHQTTEEIQEAEVLKAA